MWRSADLKRRFVGFFVSPSGEDLIRPTTLAMKKCKEKKASFLLFPPFFTAERHQSFLARYIFPRKVGSSLKAFFFFLKAAAAFPHRKHRFEIGNFPSENK